MKTYAPPYCGRQNANTTLSLQRPTKFGNYRTGGNPMIFDKDHDTAEEGRSRSLPEVKVLAAKHGRSLRLLASPPTEAK